MIKRKPKIDPTEEKVEKYLSSVWFIIRKELKRIQNGIMYMKKSSNKSERTIDQINWWLKIIGIFFMLKGISYWLTGR